MQKMLFQRLLQGTLVAGLLLAATLSPVNVNAQKAQSTAGRLIFEVVQDAWSRWSLTPVASIFLTSNPRYLAVPR